MREEEFKAMKKTDVKLKKLNDSARVPVYATDEAAACDLCACIGEDCVIGAGEIKMIPTGLAIQCGECAEYNTVILVFARSGLASKHGIALANGVGVIDTDYRGEIKVPLINQSSVPFTIHDGDRIAQMMFVPVMRAEFSLTDELDDTERGKSGFGSTGI